MEIRKKNDNKKESSHLSLKDWLTLVISFFALVIQIGGFYYVVQGLNSSEKALNSNERAVSTNTYLQTYGWTLEIDKILVENSKLRSYFNDSVSKMPSRNDYAKVEAIADYMLDVFDAVLNNKTYFKIDTFTERQWQEAVRNYFRKSPILKERFKCERNLYTGALGNVFDSVGN